MTDPLFPSIFGEEADERPEKEFEGRIFRNYLANL
jgi:hypothetical protein